MKIAKILFAVFIIAVIGFIIYEVTRKMMKQKPIDTGGNGAQPSSTGTAKDIFPLKVGSTGDEVKQFQSAVNSFLKYHATQGDNGTPSTLIADGYFGAKTAAAAKFLWQTDQITQAQFIAAVAGAKTV